jgi:hypothetical protein
MTQISFEEIKKNFSRQQKLRLLNVLKDLPSAPSSTAALVSRETPQAFITEVLCEKPTAAALSHGIKVPWTMDQGRIMQSVIENRRTLAQSANSVGKTAIASRIVLWWLYRFPGSIVITTAPNKRQVEGLLWGQLHEVRNASRTPLPGRALLASLIVDDKIRWKAVGFTANEQKGDISATAFQGWHSPHMLAILDESTLIEEGIWNSIEGMLTGPDDRILALGNPTLIGSRFHKNSHSRHWNTVVIDALNHPNVTCNDPRIIPGAVSKVWVEDRRGEWGEESALWQAKVRGQWPQQGSDTLIRLEWLVAAQDRWIEASRRDVEQDDKKGIAAGLDIAGEGTDLTVFSIIQNGAWEIPEVNGRRAFHFGKDIDKAVELVMDALAEGIHIRILSLDDTGLGQGVTATLRKYQREGKIPREMWINPINFGKSAWNDQKFELTKDQMWWDAAEVFRERDFSIPPDSEIETWGLPVGNSLQGQLIAPIYENIRQGKIAVYDKAGRRGRKEKTKGLPTKSPDLAHSFILAVHSWLKLRADAKEPPPETTEDVFKRKVQKMISKSRIRRKGDKTSHAAPWVKMRRG